MTKTIRIAPVLKSIRGKASRDHAFQIFTEGLDRGWPKRACHRFAEVLDGLFAKNDFVVGSRPFQADFWLTSAPIYARTAHMPS